MNFRMVPIQVVFDGGFIKRNCNYMYGSWVAQCPYFTYRVETKQFKNSVESNNVAEYMSLLDALEWLMVIPEKEKFSLDVRGDSMLVISQIRQAFKVKKPHLLPLRDRALELLNRFPNWNISWHRRHNSVALLGH